MIGSAVVVLWSIVTTITPNTPLITLPELSENAKVTQIVVGGCASNFYPIDQPFYLSMGSQQPVPNSFLNNMEVGPLGENNYQTYDIGTVQDALIPEDTTEYLKVVGNESENPAKVEIDILGYKFPDSAIK